MHGFKDGDHFDTVIIGAGMSGLASGIRLALFGKKVLILEKHNVVGGLNSFYSFDGRKYDVGLHALTNYAQPGTKKSPLNFLLRQLRIPREKLALAEQNYSCIAFPDIKIKFSNKAELIQTEVHEKFPEDIDGFIRLCAYVEEVFGKVPEAQSTLSSRHVLKQFIKTPLLQEMLLLPIMAYGSSQEKDLDWVQFTNLFKSIYLEGFARPFGGVRVILKALQEKYRELKGLRKMKCGVARINVSDKHAHSLTLENGYEISAKTILSSIGYPETLRLCSDQPAKVEENNVGKITFVETISVLKEQPKELGWDETIVFFNDSEKLNFCQPSDFVNAHCGVICFPNNYQYKGGQTLEEGFFRISALANYNAWAHCDETMYQKKKEEWFNLLQAKALTFLNAVSEERLASIAIAKDMFTPRTIKKYTSRLQGAVYGATHKNRAGTTHLKNLFICGTDQGMLGITGAMISGIVMTNNHLLKQ